MKAVTEFTNFALNRAIAAKTALAAEGKTPEEITQSLGEAFKLEGDKLNYFVNAIEVATQNADSLKRVLVLRLAEGEAAPAKATQIEDICYVPDFIVVANARPQAAPAKGGQRGGGNRNSGGPKGSPWGLSPEEKANKNKKPAAKA